MISFGCDKLCYIQIFATGIVNDKHIFQGKSIWISYLCFCIKKDNRVKKKTEKSVFQPVKKVPAFDKEAGINLCRQKRKRRKK